MTTLNEKERLEILSLIKLVDDDESVFTVAKEKLVSYGEPVLQLLPSADLKEPSLFAQRSIEIRELILRKMFKEEFRTLKKESNGDLELEDAVFLIARMRYSEINFSQYRTYLSSLAKELKEKTSTVLEPVEVFQRIVSFFHEEKGFKGNFEDYYNEENHYINKVLNSRLGIPISLSTVYLLVCKKINLPIYAIGLPGHFILRFSYDMNHIYFDPFNGGKVLTKANCTEIVENLGYTYSDAFLEPVSNKQIMERILRNIIVSLEQMNDQVRIETIRQHIDCLNSVS